MAIELYLIRHGLAGEHGTYANDDERPLTPEGQQKTKRVAEKLRSLDLQINLMLTSPLVRARQTAEILYSAGVSAQLQESADLAPTGKLENWLGWLDQWRQTADQRLALVGHEPCLSEWAEQLLWDSVAHSIVMKKAGVIGLLLPETGDPRGQSQMFWLTPPRLLLA